MASVSNQLSAQEKHSIHKLRAYKSIIELRNVSTVSGYGRKLLNGLCMKISPGERIAIVSIDEEEKYSMIALLAGFELPKTGSVVVRGSRIESLDKANSNSYNSFLVFEDSWLFSGTVRDNVAYGSCPKITDEEILRSAAISGLSKYLEKIDYDLNQQIHVKENELTLLERKKIELTRLDLQDPDILIFQHPLSELDSEESKILSRSLLRVTQRRASIFFCNDLKLARSADKVYILDSGKLVPYSGQSHVWDNTRHKRNLWTNKKNNQVRARKSVPELYTLNPKTKPLVLEPKTEITPGYVLTGLDTRSSETDTWTAWSYKKHQPVRIKVARTLPASKKAQEIIAREYTLLDRWTHVNISQAVESELAVKFPYSILEYIDSQTVSSIVRAADYKPDIRDLLCLGHDIASALSYIHKKGYVHNNVSTRLIRRRRNLWVLTDIEKVSKVNTSRELIDNNTHDHFFDSPEISDSIISQFSMDVYSLGRVLLKFAVGNINQTNFDTDFKSVFPQAPAQMTDLISNMLRDEPTLRPSMQRVHWEFKRMLTKDLRQDRLHERVVEPVDYEAEAAVIRLSSTG